MRQIDAQMERIGWSVERGRQDLLNKPEFDITEVAKILFQLGLKVFMVGPCVERGRKTAVSV